MLGLVSLENDCPFLAIPPELRRLVFTELFQPLKSIQITAGPPSTSAEDEETSTSWPADREFFNVAGHGLNSQLLTTCRQLYSEGLPLLYSQRCFDLTARESLKLLLHNVGPRTFSSIHRIMLDWDSLQDFAWSICKPGYTVALSGLQIIEMATWRNKHLRTTGTRWRNVKGYERMIVQAAADILDKHSSLNVVVEEHFVRRGSLINTVPVSRISDASEQPRVVESGPLRVKWRFLSSEIFQKQNEVKIDIEEDLKLLRATQDEASDAGFQLPMIDPF